MDQAASLALLQTTSQMQRSIKKRRTVFKAIVGALFVVSLIITGLILYYWVIAKKKSISLSDQFSSMAPSIFGSLNPTNLIPKGSLVNQPMPMLSTINGIKPLQTMNPIGAHIASITTQLPTINNLVPKKKTDPVKDVMKVIKWPK